MVSRLTQLRECDELASCLAGLVNPVNRSADGFLKVEPTRLGVHSGSLVLLENGSHLESYRGIRDGCCKKR